jgi:putative nucleotidyltransferase with HDIG domain
MTTATAAAAGTPAPARPKLIVIVDDRARPALADTFAKGRVKIIDCQNVDELAAIGDGPILIDVDLHDLSKVKLIKDNLRDRSGKRCTIIAVDRGSHLSIVQAQSLGASDVLARPWNREELANCLRRYASDASIGFDRDALKREPGGASIVSAAVELDRLFKGLGSGRSLDLASVEQSGDRVVDAVAEVGLAQWLDTVRRYHASTFQHCLIVTGIVTAFGRDTGMRRSDVLTLTVAGLLHDVGKAEIPLQILDKPGKLTDEEFACIKKHPAIGHDYLREQNAVSEEILRAVRHHHEYLDGSGYPDGLRARGIDDLTRIMTVCDIYGALVERRAYKAPKSPAAALDILIGMAEQGKIEYDLVKALGRSVAA